MKPTYRPSKARRRKKLGFRARNSTKAGRATRSRRIRKGRKRV